MRRLVAVLLCVVLSSVAADSGYRVTYDGGSLPDAKSGTALKLYIDQAQVRFVKDKETIVTIPATAVTEISTGRTFTGASVPLSVSQWFRSASVRLWRSASPRNTSWASHGPTEIRKVVLLCSAIKTITAACSQGWKGSLARRLSTRMP